MTHFAYLHARPDTVDATGVFYVGKGKGARHLNLTQRNWRHKAVVKTHGKANILIGKFDCSSEETAFLLEIGLIKRLRAHGVDLTNLTDGGEGRSGFVTSEEVKAKLRANASAKRPEVRAKMSAARKGHVVTAETREKIAAAKRGKPRSEELKKKLSALLQGRKCPPRSEETRAKMRAAQKGRKGRVWTEAQRAKLSASMRAVRAARRETNYV